MQPLLWLRWGIYTDYIKKNQNIEEFQHNKFSRGKWLGGLHHALPVAVPASKFFLRGQEKLLGGQKCKKCAQSAKNLPFLCWNCQIWANFNTFEII